MALLPSKRVEDVADVEDHVLARGEVSDLHGASDPWVSRTEQHGAEATARETTAAHTRLQIQNGAPPV